MFNRALSLIMENEKVEVYEKSTTVKDGGGTSISWKKVKDLFCNIQSEHGVANVSVNSESGDKTQSKLNLRCYAEIKENQRIKRDGIMYEIRNVGHNGKGTILEHYMAKLVRVTQ